MLSGRCLGYSPCFLVVVLVTLHVFSCCLYYSPCFLVVVLVTLHVSEPKSNTIFALVLKIRIVCLAEKDGVFHTVFEMVCLVSGLSSLFLCKSAGLLLHLYVCT